VSRHAEPRKPELLEGERPSTPIRRTLSYRGAQARAFATLSRLPGPRVVSSISPPPFFGIGDISLSSLLTGGSLPPTHPPLCKWYFLVKRCGLAEKAGAMERT
jgi:hypothetical protein